MNDSAFFATFNPLFCETPQVCDVCSINPPVFHFECCTEDEKKERQFTKGYCCERCAPELLKRLTCTESREWAEEEAALEADGMDTSDFHKRRLAAFGSSADSTEEPAIASTAEKATR